MFGLLGLRRPLQAFASTTVSTALTTHNSIFTRTLMKSHKGAAKRWRKAANGFKRSQAARNHGNAGWSSSTLRGDGSKAMSTKQQTKRLTKLLPYH
ncbi:hypothetical protein BON22_1951 [Cyberlindnera fabianii]|nr:hypothetical protein BON22_1951 [Cyberlindnera fabianii]